jgi:hypothetical protein
MQPLGYCCEANAAVFSCTEKEVTFATIRHVFLLRGINRIFRTNLDEGPWATRFAKRPNHAGNVTTTHEHNGEVVQVERVRKRGRRKS